MKSAFLALLVTLVLAPVYGCANHAPPTLSPAGVIVYQSNEAVVGIGTLQHAAIELNKAQVCDANGAACHPILSDANTRVVIDAVTDALNTIKEVPTGWKATVTTALDRVQTRLDAAGKGRLKPYIDAAKIIVNGQ